MISSGEIDVQSQTVWVWSAGSRPRSVSAAPADGADTSERETMRAAALLVLAAALSRARADDARRELSHTTADGCEKCDPDTTEYDSHGSHSWRQCGKTGRCVYFVTTEQYCCQGAPNAKLGVEEWVETQTYNAAQAAQQFGVHPRAKIRVW